jgi:hypothetical protein
LPLSKLIGQIADKPYAALQEIALQRTSTQGCQLDRSTLRNGALQVKTPKHRGNEQMKKHNQIGTIAILILMLSGVSIFAQDKPIPQIARNTGAVTKAAEPKAEEAEAAEKIELKKEYSEILPDDSYLVENANNVAPGHLHSITTCMVSRAPGKDTACGLTQEISTGGGKHLFSYTASYSFLDSNRVKGVGDVALTYRRQLTGEEDWAVVSPRFTVFIPTGNVNKGLGSGSLGFQFNLPVTKRLSESFLANFNAGTTIFPSVKGQDETGRDIKRAITAYNVGGSLVWVAHKNFNPLIEYVENFASEIGETGRVVRFNEHVVSPGAGFAWKFGEIKVSPGIAIPVTFSRGEVRTGVLFYIGIENLFFNRPRVAVADAEAPDATK